jgi:cell division protein FtsB
MRLRPATLVMLALLAGVQGGLWLGKGSLPHVWSLQRQLDTQRAHNEVLAARNRATAAEVADLKEGLEMVEEKARSELGMLRPDEVLVQLTPRR